MSKINWRKEPKVLINAIKAMGFRKGIKYYFSILYDMYKLGYFKY